MNLTPGSYESILTRRLQEALQGLDGSWSHQLEKLNPVEAADRLSLHLSRVIEKVLSAMPGDQRVAAGSKLVSELIVQALQGKLDALAGEIVAYPIQIISPNSDPKYDPSSKGVDTSA